MDGSLKLLTLTFKFRWKRFIRHFLSKFVFKSSGKFNSSSNLIATQGFVSESYDATFHALHRVLNFVYKNQTKYIEKN